MRGLILAAGRGSRLLPVSATRPKHTVPVAGVPIIARAAHALRGAGLSEIGVVTSPALEPELREALAGAGAVTFIQQAEPLGTGDAVLSARAFIGEHDTLLYLGDNLFQDDLRPLRAALTGADAVLGVKRVPNPRAYGVAVVQGGWLTRLTEKPREPESDLAACGVFAFRPPLLEVVADLPPSERGEIEFPQALTRLIEAGGRVRTVEFPGFWSDAGTPADLLTADAFFLGQQAGRVSGRVTDSQLSGAVVVEAGASVEGSRLTGPVWIGPHAQVRGAALGPNVSVGAHARIEGSTLEGTLIDEFARVSTRTPLRGSVIGRHAQITAADGPEAHLIVGDRSSAQL